VGDAEVVPLAAVNPNGDSDHEGIVTPEDGRPLVAASDRAARGVEADWRLTI